MPGPFGTDLVISDANTCADTTSPISPAANEAVNAQNCLIRGTASANLVHEQSLHPDYITVWCGFAADFILDPITFEEKAPHGPQRRSLPGARYCDLLQQQVIPDLQEP
ncbi:hypothetical protein AVEN_76702-1 [Araneus ventricosus]|uniref:Uncharacterized protein n=1 Tax=Araneus ventricosus TaxID=182803 RepID=A0A4Y2BP25_ARAVE|nr:hypothetical protein AVEN_76702-1 [Araneus ventricosus]